MPEFQDLGHVGVQFDSPGVRHFAIDPADGQDLPIRPRVLRVLATGNLAVRDELGETIVYPVFAGETFAFSGVGIDETGTTADVVGWL
ncbi:hypothetical protein KMP13_02380 [Epibacterium ulvae]|uniref:spike base protein, RCAP_Rcc01079 family n=1 Tax=Epibacterium ulvae TaxID=1156985 RepID=UPI001BFC6C6E|nr:hypothetical protein [Epibacterium ulvae]MBT8152761.1 hypothetical protein [Epibacterium ulvae]